MSVVTKTTIELTHSQKTAIARIAAQRQLNTGERFTQTDFVRDAIEAALQANTGPQPTKGNGKRSMLITFEEPVWRTIQHTDAATVSREINAALCREMEAA